MNPETTLTIEAAKELGWPTSFDFGNFRVYFYQGVLQMEQYSEGMEGLPHVKTLADYAELHRLLTGEPLTIK